MNNLKQIVNLFQVKIFNDNLFEYLKGNIYVCITTPYGPLHMGIIEERILNRSLLLCFCFLVLSFNPMCF